MACCKCKKKRLKSALLAPVVWLVAMAWMAERAIWRVLTATGQALGRLPILRQIEQAVVKLPPWGAALLMLSPLLFAEPMKIEALRLFCAHRWMAGSGLLLAAKIGGTAFGARVYTLCRPALMQLGWFARGHERFMKAKAFVEGTAAAQRILGGARRAKADARAWVKQQARRASLALRRSGGDDAAKRALARAWTAWRRFGRQKARQWARARVA
jgi:hypothetical protein